MRHGYGCDDIGACIDFLLDEKVIKGGSKGSKMTWREYEGTRAKMIQMIEQDNRENLLFRDTQDTWQEIEESLRPNRKSKYED